MNFVVIHAVARMNNCIMLLKSYLHMQVRVNRIHMRVLVSIMPVLDLWDDMEIQLDSPDDSLFRPMFREKKIFLILKVKLFLISKAFKWSISSLCCLYYVFFVFIIESYMLLMKVKPRIYISNFNIKQDCLNAPTSIWFGFQYFTVLMVTFE